jgi:hypothetical protein
MGVDDSTVIVLSSKRYQGAPLLDESQKVTLEQTSHEIVSYDRIIDISLEERFNEERQRSQIFRPTTKFNFIFKNKYSGSTVYQPYVNYLYYVNPELSAEQVACGNSVVNWFGFPQYTEFDFIRTDNNNIGYTNGIGNHQVFLNKSATTYNWINYMSYPFENDYTKQLYVHDPETLATWDIIASDGIPFLITSNVDNIITFKCPMKHGLILGEYVYLTINYLGNNLFEIFSLGDSGSGSDEYIFNIYNIGYLGNTFDVGTTGTLKRVLDPINSGETMSEYYVRRHKIITNVEDAVLVRTGFENNSFNTKTKYEKVLTGGSPVQTLTPSTLPRTSVLDDSKTYTLSFNRDIDIGNLLDNQKRPISELFFTTIWKGYWGWTNKLKSGFQFNVPLQNQSPCVWWDVNNPLSDINIPTEQYTSNVGEGPFFYNGDLFSGDTIDGDFCEWNDYLQTERVVSRQTHKFTFNQSWFTQYDYAQYTNQKGYYYYPLNPITIAVYSPYIEDGDANVVEGIPNYAFYSNRSDGFRWRDIYPYGFIDTEGIGVDYPFTNGKHYPFKNTIFRLFYEGIGQQDITQIEDPTIDGCE